MLRASDVEPSPSTIQPRHPTVRVGLGVISASHLSNGLCDGASILVIGRRMRRMTLCSSDTVAARLEGLQFDLGEGPQREVMRTGIPVLSADLSAPTSSRRSRRVGPFPAMLPPGSVRRPCSAEADEDPEDAGTATMRREVHQATRMSLAQLELSTTEAFSLLRGHAFASSRTTENVATDVVARRLDLRCLPD